MTTYNYPLLAEQDMVPEYIKKGSFARIYQVSRSADLVVKVPIEEDGLSTLIREYAVHQALFESGISVPEPKGMHRITWDGRSKELYRQNNDPEWYFGRRFLSGFVMEYVHSFRLDEFAEVATVEEYARAVELRDLELTRARERGFRPIDVCRGNVLYIPNQDRVVLIDFECWGVRK